MKVSRYNTILFPDPQHALIYNALSDKFVALNSDEFNRNGGNLLGVTDEKLREKFIEIGALVNDDVDADVAAAPRRFVGTCLRHVDIIH